MTQRALALPRDNKLVDDDGRLLPQWRPVLEAAARLSRLSDGNLTSLLGVLDDENGFLGAGGGGAVGDILYKGSDGWLNLPIGVEGSILTSTRGLPAYTASETLASRVLIGEYNAAGLTNVVVGPFDGTAYHKYEIDLDWVEQSGVGGTLSSEVSEDPSFGSTSTIYGAANFSSWAGAGVTSAIGTATGPMTIANGAASMVSSGKMHIENYSPTVGFGTFSYKCFSSFVGSAGGSVWNGAFRAPGAITPYVRIAVSAGNWVSGTFRVYGIP